MGIWKRITTDPRVTGLAFLVGYFVIENALGLLGVVVPPWPFVIAYAAVTWVAILTVHHRHPPA